MITKERQEHFCQVVNARWPSTAEMEEQGEPYFWIFDVHQFDQTENDLCNAGFIVWALDRLEELGHTVTLFPSPRGGYLAAFERVFVAPTRAECLFLALLSALESSEQVAQESTEVSEPPRLPACEAEPPKFFLWVAECCKLLGWRKDEGVKMMPEADLSWYLAFDDGLTPAQAVNAYQAAQGDTP